MKKYFQVQLIKRFLCHALGLLTSISSFSQSSSYPDVKLEILEPVDGKAYLFSQLGPQRILIDSSTFNYHTASFLLKDQPEGLYVMRYKLATQGLTAKEFNEISFIHHSGPIHIRLTHANNKQNAEVPHSAENKKWLKYLMEEEEKKARLQYIFHAKEVFENDDQVIKNLKKKLKNEQQIFQKQLKKLTQQKNKSLVDALIFHTFAAIPPFEFDEDEAKAWQAQALFERAKFDQPELLRSNAYENILFNFITSQYQLFSDRKEQEKAVLKSVRLALEKTKNKPEIHRRMKSFIREGLIQMNALEALAFMNELYPEEKCAEEGKEKSFLPLFEGQVLYDDAIEMIRKISPESNNQFKIIIFWASWCPYSNLLAKELKGINIRRDRDYYLFDLAAGPEDCGKAKARFPDWFHYQCEGNAWDSKAAELLGIQVLPFVILLDKNFQIINTPETLQEMLKLMTE